jgi:transcriptional regulator with GAF, ATPase, and Fis domain
VDEQPGEIRRLRACINDLVSMLALPALWNGHEPRHIMGTLLDVVLRVLALEFAYARIDDTVDGSPIELARLARGQAAAPQTKDIGRALNPWLAADPTTSPLLIPNPVGEGECAIALVRSGMQGEIGVLAAGSHRTDFPTEVEALLLNVAANQAAIGLQEARRLNEQRWAAELLDQRVADRTAELLSANEKLRLEIVQRKRAEEELKKAFDEITILKEQLGHEKRYLEEEIRQERGFEEILGESPALKKNLKQVAIVAPTDSTVLIQGETGTGKELIARAIHNLSNRRERTFVKINCAAIPTGLLESELFGHEKGAFTGAVAQRMGRFELANGGTIFLDEVGEIPLELQVKLLRVLQEQEFERLGSSRTVRVDVRLVAASNRDLAQMIEDREFRSDLYYRLKVFPIIVPPLRERIEDIPILVRHFTEHHARRCKRSITNISAETMTALCRYHWPGNIRELENLIERSVILSQGPSLEVPLGELKHTDAKTAVGPTFEDIQRQHILHALDECNWVIAGPSGAALKLGMKRTSLQYKMQKFGITRPH